MKSKLTDKLCLWLSMALLFVCISCQNESSNSEQLPADQAPKDSLVSSPDTITHKEEAPKPVNCTFDPITFKAKMGIGLVILSGTVFPLKIYPNPDGSGQPLLLSISKEHYWEIIVSDRPKSYFQWYFGPNEYEDGSIIWRDTSANNDAIGIQMNEAAPTYWIMRDTTEKGWPLFHTINWEKILMDKIFTLNPSDKEHFSFKQSPKDDALPSPPSPKGKGLYSVVAVKYPWIQVNRLLETNGPFGDDKWSEPIGWMKWFCDGQEQVEFPNPFQVEDYYVD